MNYVFKVRKYFYRVNNSHFEIDVISNINK